MLPAGNLDAQKVAAPATFRTSSQMVLVPVTVTDRAGRSVEGLRAEDFNVLDDQSPQPIVSFTSEDAPCSVGIVLDVSGSMRASLGTAKDVAAAFFGTAGPDDEFLLLTVSTQPEALPGFTANVEALGRSIELSQPGGRTALIDTVYLGLSRMREARRGRRALLVLSDGLDNQSRYSQAELLRLAVEADVQVYTVILNTDPAVGSSSSPAPFRPRMTRKPIDQAEERLGADLLEKLAEKTGGVHYRANNKKEAKEAVAKAGRMLRNMYVIGYQPPDSGLAGKWHRVRVKSTVPEVNVHARNGYYQP
jgi:Ca-activated chloride channel family protein